MGSISASDEVGASVPQRITITVSPVNRAEELFALARYLNRRFQWPYFCITSLVDGCAVFTACESGWQHLRRELEDNRDSPLSIVAIEGNCVKLHVASLTTIGSE